jgi:hypothetical protein
MSLRKIPHTSYYCKGFVSDHEGTYITSSFHLSRACESSTVMHSVDNTILLSQDFRMLACPGVIMVRVVPSVDAHATPPPHDNT